MGHIRKNFSDKRKAEIFARDRATCCFSGANLWLLDAPLRPGYQIDWVDHIKPSSKGGTAESTNGVCASHSFNSKKRDNSADTDYLFFEGKPTETYFRIFGELDTAATRRLKRFGKLSDYDWYFNRALANILLGFDWRCQKEIYQIEHKRDDQYWFRAGFTKLNIFLKNSEVPSFKKRGLLTSSTEKLWLNLTESSTFERMLEVVEGIFPKYQKNYYAWAAYFWDARSETDFYSAYQSAKDQHVDAAIIGCIEQDLDFRSKQSQWVHL